MFRRLLKHGRFAEALLREKLPAPWRRRIAGPPELLSEHFIDPKLKTRIADAVLRAPLKGGGSLVVYVIVEHKREEGAEDLLQVGQYVLDLHRWLLTTHGLPMPPVLPLILYNGQQPWRGARSFQELLDPRITGWKDALSFTATVIDVGRLPTHSIARAQELRQGLLTLKTPAVPLAEVEATVVELLRATRGDVDARNLAFTYLSQTLPIEARPLAESAQKKYKRAEEPTMQTWAQELKKRGEVLGEKRGERRGEKRGERKATERALRTVLTSRFGKLPRDFDARLERASLDTLLKWIARAATVPSADVLFAE